MRHRLLLLAALIAGFGCGSGSGKVTDGGGTGGGGGVGPDGGGVDGGGAGGGTGGAAGAAGSPGTVTLRLALPPGTTYCDQASTCQPVRHIAVRSAAGQGLALDFGDCATPCDTCQPTPCPGIACLPMGLETRDEELTWNGSYYETSTCGAQASQCRRQHFAPPGQYVAVFCATAGRLDQPDAGVGRPACQKTGELQCVEVPFTFPSATPVVGRLTGAGPVACGASSCGGAEVCVNPCCGGAAPPCHPADGGVCPAGSSSCIVVPGGGPGCATPCTPPPSFCQPATKPLPTGCSLGKDRQVICVCA